MVDKPLPTLDYHQQCGLAIQGWEFEATRASKKSGDESSLTFSVMSSTEPTSSWDAVFDPNRTFHITRRGTEYRAGSPLSTSPVEPALTSATASSPLSVHPQVPQIESRAGSIYADALESQRDENEEREDEKGRYYLDVLYKIRDMQSFETHGDQEQAPTPGPGLRLVATKDTMTSAKRPVVLEQRLFWYGFLCPLLWFVALCRRPRANARRRMWKMRCGRAATLFGLSCICCLCFWIIYKAIAKGRHAQPIASVIRS
ncbi:hypothetical protein DFQ28_009741 [Apophysomyces sp. BC1034]|nr:hypothetical protein DFQ30_005946 [Apophysomyces sp. BC1015]KAG0182345.1 hypothetical protein DFQ29_004585 [Apophysomyces sp. BC1021]KAG0194534.1 hypothetical protein DFQ28_009741 [Apophysomyces sp. BC1034]